MCYLHFHSHTLLTKLSAGELRAEFDYSIAFFENLFDQRITEICIPFGGQNSREQCMSSTSPEKIIGNCSYG